MCECILRFDRSGVGGEMPTSPHRGVHGDSSAKRLRSWVQRASEAADGETTTEAGRMPVAFARKARLFSIAFLQIQLELWDAAEPRVSETQIALMRAA